MQKYAKSGKLCENLEIMRFSHNSHNHIIHGALTITFQQTDKWHAPIGISSGQVASKVCLLPDQTGKRRAEVEHERL